MTVFSLNPRCQTNRSRPREETYSCKKDGQQMPADLAVTVGKKYKNLVSFFKTFATSYKILQNLASPRKPRRPPRERVPAEDARELEARGPRDGGRRREHLKTLKLAGKLRSKPRDAVDVQVSNNSIFSRSNTYEPRDACSRNDANSTS